MDYGFVGDVDYRSMPTWSARNWTAVFMPVISPLSADASGTLLNINADTVAAALAAALAAEKMILITGAPGILENRDDPASLVSYIDLAGPAETP